jgi:photosystem II stability/assembly factor-like uncharacterized protein
LTGVTCASEKTCFAVGASAPNCLRATVCAADDPLRTPATIFATTDGKSWALRDPGTSERLNGASCATATSCVAVGDLGTVVRTQDGSSWSVVADPGNTRGAAMLLGVSCPASTQVCVAVGDHGAAFRSGDAGATWSSSPTGTQEYLNAVSCASASRCVAVGSAGTVLRSLDGGSSWTAVDPGPTEALHGVSCPTTQRCVAVGVNGTTLTSGDGGASWTARSTPAQGADLLAVSCSSASDCAASGSDGTMLASTTGGAAWTRRGTGTLRSLSGVSCPAAKTCYEVGELGAILQPPQPTGYVRPRGATPMYASLVPAFTPCTAPNRNHGSPLAFPSCRPPAPLSSALTVGTPDSNGREAHMVSSVRYDVRPGNPATSLNEADVLANVSIADVRRRSDLGDYTGQLRVDQSVRITDRLGEPTTAQDVQFPVTVPCTATASTSVGSTCSLSSTFDAILPGVIVEDKRAVWELGDIRVFDDDNKPFARQGVFVP